MVLSQTQLLFGTTTAAQLLFGSLWSLYMGDPCHARVLRKFCPAYVLDTDTNTDNRYSSLEEYHAT